MWHDPGDPEMTNCFRYTAEHKKFIEDHSSGFKYRELAALFNEAFPGSNRTESTMNAYFGNHHMTNGVDGRFKKGHASPFGRFKKGMHYSPETEFKKGQKPVNMVPIGTEVVKADGYLYRKLANTIPSRFGWKRVSQINWEAVHGPVPPGHRLLFTDGNRMNVHPDNLVLVTPAQMATMNHKKLVFQDSELTKTGLILAGLVSAASRKTKIIKERKRNAKQADRS